MDIATTLATIKTAIGVGKIVIETGKSLSEADLKLRIVELITALSDARTGIAELQDQLRERDGEISDLKRQAQVVREMTWEHPSYWRETDGKRDGPYCQKCFDDERKSVRLIDMGNGYLTCSVCKTVYEGRDYARHRAREDALLRSTYDPFA